MKQELFSLILLSVLTGGMTFLLENSKFEKHFRYLSMLVLLIAMIAPIRRLLGRELAQQPDFFSAGDPADLSEYKKNLSKQTEEALENSLTELIRSKTDLKEGKDFLLYVSVICDENELRLGDISVSLKTFSALSKRESIRALLSDVSGNITFTEEL